MDPTLVDAFKGKVADIQNQVDQLVSEAVARRAVTTTARGPLDRQLVRDFRDKVSAISSDFESLKSAATALRAFPTRPKPVADFRKKVLKDVGPDVRRFKDAAVALDQLQRVEEFRHQLEGVQTAVRDLEPQEVRVAVGALVLATDAARGLAVTPDPARFDIYPALGIWAWLTRTWGQWTLLRRGFAAVAFVLAIYIIWLLASGIWPNLRQAQWFLLLAVGLVLLILALWRWAPRVLLWAGGVVSVVLLIMTVWDASYAPPCTRPVGLFKWAVFWGMAPPLFWWWQWFYVFPSHRNADNLETFKYGAQQALAIWAAVVVGLATYATSDYFKPPPLGTDGKPGTCLYEKRDAPVSAPVAGPVSAPAPGPLLVYPFCLALPLPSARVSTLEPGVLLVYPFCLASASDAASGSGAASGSDAASRLPVQRRQ
ncbi:hypothetical protein AB4Y32_39165 [Paraburkholderia phymatum]|uniref:Uncharacterized protein n=1 Tax=Paraburkholderia phymatum TaxID=148447 RepID=A0ACC6UDE4_9BURK